MPNINTIHAIKKNSILIILLLASFQLSAQIIDSSFIKGKSEFEIGNYTKSLAYFNKAISLHKTEKDLNYMAAMSEYNLSHYSSAKKYFSKELSINPKNINAFLFKAKAKEQLHKNKSALRDLKKALKLDSTNLLILLERAHILFNQKKYTKAIHAYLKVKALSPKTEIVYYKLGFCEFYLDHTSQACDYWSNLEDVDDFENYETIIKTCNIKN